jgi:hypothetical protein
MHLCEAFPGFISPKSISSIEKNTFDPIVETNERYLGISSIGLADFALNFLEYPVPSINNDIS